MLALIFFRSGTETAAASGLDGYRGQTDTDRKQGLGSEFHTPISPGLGSLEAQEKQGPLQDPDSHDPGTGAALRACTAPDLAPVRYSQTLTATPPVSTQAP